MPSNEDVEPDRMLGLIIGGGVMMDLSGTGGESRVKEVMRMEIKSWMMSKEDDERKRRETGVEDTVARH